MSLSWSRFGKAETRLLRVTRDGRYHDVTDLNVSVELEGDFRRAYCDGDNSGILPTDSQKNAVLAMANEGVGEIEDFAVRLARHFATAHPSIERARVAVEQYGWERVEVEGMPHPHSFLRAGGEVRRAEGLRDRVGEWVLSGIAGLNLLKSTGSEFQGFLRDRYTTLEDAQDRILATAVQCRWLHAGEPTDWGGSFSSVRRALIQTFAETYSRSLQETLYAMGLAVLDLVPEVAEVRLSMPNRHHVAVDLTPFGEHNQGVFFPTDRPYGLIEGAVARDGGVRPAWIWGRT